MIDTHAHLAAAQFDQDRDGVIKRALEAGVKGILCVLSDLARLKLFEGLLQSHEFMYGAIGIDPFSSDRLAELSNCLEEALLASKVAAIGEIGLDYYHRGCPSSVQKRAFRHQLALARETGLPVIVHCRDAFEETIDVLSEFSDVRGIMHCFSGTLEQMRLCVELGFYISLAGVVTFPNTAQLAQVCCAIPEERLLVETDCPYLAPQAVRGQRCEPVHLTHTVAEVASIRGQSVERVSKLTSHNARQALGIGEVWAS